jgi:hypothetical protein
VVFAPWLDFSVLPALSLKRLLGLPNPGQTPLFVGHPVRRLVATLIGAQGGVLLGIGRVGRVRPGFDLGTQILLGLRHPLIAPTKASWALCFDAPTYKNRNRIGRGFGWLTDLRRIATRWPNSQKNIQLLPPLLPSSYAGWIDPILRCLGLIAGWPERGEARVCADLH